MVTADESKAALRLLTAEAVETSTGFLEAVGGAPEARRAALLDGVPEIIGYFSAGSAALAVDFYEEAREVAGVQRAFVTELVLVDRTVKIRRAVAWAADPLFTGDEVAAASRLAEVVQFETATPYRDTMLSNRRRDEESVGWRRVTSGGCRFCRMLADRGAVYRKETARFASHPNCHCIAEPVFSTNDPGTEVGVLQYVASARRKTPAQKAAVKAYLDAHYPE
jgi:hypothetical protein